MVSATTRSAAVKGLVHVAVQPLIAALWFPLLLRGPSPARPAPPGSRARTRRAPGRTRGGGTTRRGRPPPARAPPGRLAAPQPGDGRHGESSPRAGRRREQQETRAGAGAVRPRRQPVVSSILHVPHDNLRARVQTGRPRSYYFLRLPTSRTDKRVRFLKRPVDGAFCKEAGKVRLKVRLGSG